ncbi:MAG: SGNH/GDSL hydrolase family protein [Bacteroidia bacterium]
MKLWKLVILYLIMISYKPMDTTQIRYVALGDSYTIGTGANEDQAWPTLLAKHLKENKINIDLIANPSHNGWTTQNLIDFEYPVLDKSKPTFVTLLIGVNDWVQGVDATAFQKNLVKIIDHVQGQLPDKSKLLLITIPDFGVTPTGARYSGGRDISKGIAEFNKIIMDEAKKRNLKTVDLFSTSKEMGKDNSLIAADGLHPSAKEYAIWETLIYPVASAMLK